MKLLDTTHKRKSMTLTIVLFLLLALCLILFGLRYMDPPEQKGIAVNFGVSDVGSGNVQPEKPIESTPNKTTTPPPTESVASKVEEEVVTQDTEDAPVIENEKKEEPKPETKPIEEELEPAPEPEPEPEPEPDKTTSDAISNLLNAPKSDGTD